MTDNNHVVLWERCLKIIADNVPGPTYERIFLSIWPVKFEEGTLTLGVPSSFVCEYLEEHYIDLLRYVIYREYGEGTHLKYRVLIDKENKQEQEWESDNSSQAVRPKPILADGNKVLPARDRKSVV